MLTTCYLLADTVNVCAELGGVLETVPLGSLLIAPAMLEAAAVVDRRKGCGESRAERGEAGI